MKPRGLRSRKKSAARFRFFADRDLYSRDRNIGLLRRVHPGLMTFEDWLRHTGWTGP